MRLDPVRIVLLVVAAVALGVSLATGDWLWALATALICAELLLHAWRNRS